VFQKLLKGCENELGKTEFQRRISNLVELIGTTNNLVERIKALLDDLKQKDNLTLSAEIDV